MTDTSSTLITPEALAWYESMDAEYHRDTGVHLWEIEEKVTGRKQTAQDIADAYERHYRSQRPVESPTQPAPALYKGMLVRRRTEDRGIYRVTGWAGVPTMNGVAVTGINADLTAKGAVTAIPPGVMIFCCANLKGDPQFIYAFRTDEVEPMGREGE